jgi:hypothetical protein
MILLGWGRDRGTHDNDGATTGRSGEAVTSFALEDRVPADHLLRKIDQFLDLSILRQGLVS